MMMVMLSAASGLEMQQFHQDHMVEPRFFYRSHMNAHFVDLLSFAGYTLGRFFLFLETPES